MRGAPWLVEERKRDGLWGGARVCEERVGGGRSQGQEERRQGGLRGVGEERRRGELQGSEKHGGAGRSQGREEMAAAGGGVGEEGEVSRMCGLIQRRVRAWAASNVN